MNLIEQIVGLVPTVRDRFAALVDIMKSTTAKVSIVVLVAIAALGYAYHRGAASQKATITSLQAEISNLQAKIRLTPENPNKNWLEEQARVNEALSAKVQKYEQELAKRPQDAGDRVSEHDARRLLSIR